MTSFSPQPTTHRLRRGVLALVMCLLLLEIGVRLPPVHAALSAALDPYESLLWYYGSMPAYQAQLRDGSHYDLWLLGSSYLATAINPSLMQDQLATEGVPLTVQNYGFSLMQNLSDMALVVERWMFTLDKPRYALIGVGWGNYGSNGLRPTKARTSPMERATIFRDTLHDIVGGWVYAHSDLFRYATLARYGLTVPVEQTEIQPMPVGGFVANKDTYQCDEALWVNTNRVMPYDMPGHLQRLDALIDTLQRNNVPVAVVSIPVPFCSYRRVYTDTDSYINLYLEPMKTHLAERGIPYAEFDRRFFAAFPDPADQEIYYNDPSHPNEKGAAIFSEWAGEFVAEWLHTQQP